MLILSTSLTHIFFFCPMSFFFFYYYFFTLQYCIGFAIHQHESAMGVHTFPILNFLPLPSLYHLSGSSQCTSPKHPVSCIEPALAIRFIYDNTHVSMLFSQIIPPSPSPAESKSLFFVSLLLSCMQGYLSKFHTYVLVFLFLTYLTLYNRLQFHPPYQS